MHELYFGAGRSGLHFLNCGQGFGFRASKEEDAGGSGACEEEGGLGTETTGGGAGDDDSERVRDSVCGSAYEGELTCFISDGLRECGDDLGAACCGGELGIGSHFGGLIEAFL